MGLKGKTALVFSAGGMYGAYQAGVWLELEKVFRPDLVVGASIGSLNGWFVAGGVPASDLVHRWLTLHDAADHQFQIPRYLSDGFVRGHMVEKWIREIFSVAKPRCEYALVTTELCTMRPRLFQWPDLNWTHLAASCAVPLLLKQHRIDGSLHADGGLVDPLPVWAALELGAQQIVAVNLLVNRPVAVRAAARIAGLCGNYRRPDTSGVDLLLIEPSGSLGTIRDAMYWTPSNTDALIAMGQADARAALRGCHWLDTKAAA